MIPPAVSAQNPAERPQLVIRDPIVFTMRQPPIAVPSAIAVWAESTTQNGMWSAFGQIEVAAASRSRPRSRACEATSRPTMMPIVFCASLAPWLSE